MPGLRLPRDVVPLTYDPKLRIDPGSDTFSGTIEIKVRVLEPVDLVWLNAKNLTIREASAAILGPQEETVAAATVPGNDNVTGLQFAKVLPAGEARLWISYTGMIESVGAVGLFRQQEAGEWYAVTQFEPLDARRVFPSFDEPDRKAEWKLTLEVPAAMRAFANMPVEAERATRRGWREVSFQRTPPLPSYLIAFAVGAFDVRDGGKAGQGRTPISIITPKGRAAEAAYAAANTGAILAATEKYFGHPYPFPKLDLIAYPRSTFGGAMENPGLITYTAQILLARPDEMSPIFEQRFVGFTAHEIAHMWFGDYVTPAWWNDIWLNESFASWMGTAITAELRPDWPRSWRSRQRSKAMEFDRLSRARRIRQPVTEYGEVRAAFDSITYAKGESILAMFEQWLGPDKFREGVRRYMAKFAWGNATAEDFFAALAATDEALVPAFRGYVERAGVPLLRVGLDCSAAPALALAQERFVPVGAPPPRASAGYFPPASSMATRPAARRFARWCATRRRRWRCPRTPARNGSSPIAPALAIICRASRPRYMRHWGRRSACWPAPTMQCCWPTWKCWRAAARSGTRKCCRSPHGRRTIPIRAQLAARSILPTAFRRQWSRRPTTRSSLRGSAATTVHARGLWVGFRAKATRPELLRLRETALPLVAERGRDAALARAAQRLAQRWLIHRKAVAPDTRRIVLVTAARTIGADAPRLFDALLVIARSGKDRNERDDVFAALGSFRDPALLARAMALGLRSANRRARRVDGPGGGAVPSGDAGRRGLTWFAGPCRRPDPGCRAKSRVTVPKWADAARARPVSARSSSRCSSRAPPASTRETRRYRESLEKIDLCLALRARRRHRSMPSWPR